MHSEEVKWRIREQAYRFREARHKAGWSLLELGAATEIAPEDLEKYERGQIGLPSDYVRILCNRLGVTYAWLVGGFE
jgi:transcriptional regulator with XRE-family HTH domain